MLSNINIRKNAEYQEYRKIMSSIIDDTLLTRNNMYNVCNHSGLSLSIITHGRNRLCLFVYLITFVWHLATIRDYTVS